jgi:hypothetical protein
MAFEETSLRRNRQEALKRVLYRFINCFQLHPLSFGPFNFLRLLVSPTFDAKSRLLRDVKMFLSIFNIEFGKLVFWITSNDFFPLHVLLSMSRTMDIIFQ